MSKARLLTKSRFKTACECPSKLFFTGKSDYASTRTDNSFLDALAEGGFQVGELAKLFNPGGLEIETLESEIALSQSRELLNRETVTLFEAALGFEKLLVRVDILRKVGNRVDLVEVKAKGFDSTESNLFWNKKNKGLMSRWEPYLLDVAFQTYVAQKAFPEWEISPYLMLADKHAVTSVEGLNQLFELSKDATGKSRASLSPGRSLADAGAPILKEVDVSAEVNFIHREWESHGKSFEELVRWLADAYAEDRYLPTGIGSKCKNCEFRIEAQSPAEGQKIGFEKCWSEQAGLKPEDFSRPFVFDVWKYRLADKKISEGIYFQDQLDPAEFGSVDADQAGMQSWQRQALQVRKVIEKDTTPYIDKQGLLDDFSRWIYPLHFIDFETSQVAIPFGKGRHPYEQVAFQFSHHRLEADGRISHATEYIDLSRGKFPSFDFVRALRRALSEDRGSIFRYSPHENVVLCQIHEQLLASEEPDRKELCQWIETVTTKKDAWKGPRTMIDLLEVVMNRYYNPLTDGSNSLKSVLPAVLANSKYLQTKYSQPIYGAQAGLTSHNYKDWTWIQRDASGKILDPYSLLGENEIREGGAAMTAYARTQFASMPEPERALLARSLLRYCELDTFAMVLVYEHLADEIGWWNRATDT
jgi:hypothetical protein